MLDKRKKERNGKNMPAGAIGNILNKQMFVWIFSIGSCGQYFGVKRRDLLMMQRQTNSQQWASTTTSACSCEHFLPCGLCAISEKDCPKAKISPTIMAGTYDLKITPTVNITKESDA